MRIVIVMTITICFGVFGEWMQIYIPGRYASVTDCGLNSAGALVGLLYFSHRSKALNPKKDFVNTDL